MGFTKTNKKTQRLIWPWYNIEEPHVVNPMFFLIARTKGQKQLLWSGKPQVINNSTDNPQYVLKCVAKIIPQHVAFTALGLQNYIILHPIILVVKYRILLVGCG